ncbi:hypothetical protein B0H19DRAFT_79893 [Mycena capillaripes]|nr:hypothetical protein B0H19DRAFT_79893 [Mycena capillaripes]
MRTAVPYVDLVVYAPWSAHCTWDHSFPCKPHRIRVTNLLDVPRATHLRWRCVVPYTTFETTDPVRCARLVHTLSSLPAIAPRANHACPTALLTGLTLHSHIRPPRPEDRAVSISTKASARAAENLQVRHPCGLASPP